MVAVRSTTAWSSAHSTNGRASFHRRHRRRFCGVVAAVGVLRAVASAVDLNVITAGPTETRHQRWYGLHQYAGHGGRRLRALNVITNACLSCGTIFRAGNRGVTRCGGVCTGTAMFMPSRNISALKMPDASAISSATLCWRRSGAMTIWCALYQPG